MSLFPKISLSFPRRLKQSLYLFGWFSLAFIMMKIGSTVCSSVLSYNMSCRRQTLYQIFLPAVITVRCKSLVRRPLSMDKPNPRCKVTGLDHLVLTVKDIEKSITFYTIGLGMSLVEFGEGRKALQFGNQKINLHQSGKEFKPHATKPAPGSADICFVTEEPLPNWIAQLKELGVSIEEGPVKRTGAVGPITSIYVRDPDGNLVEIANY